MTEKWAVLGAGLSAAAFLRGLASGPMTDGGRKLCDVTIFSHEADAGAAVNGAQVSVTGKTLGDTTPLLIPSALGFESYLKDGLAGSSGFGGWSQVWGATWHPRIRESLHAWPATLRPALESAVGFVEQNFMPLGVTGKPNSDQTIGPVRIVPDFVAKINRQPVPTNFAGPTVSFLPSSLFIKPLAAEQSSGCNQCGLCLTGCPAGHIWSGKVEIEALIRDHGFTHESTVSITSLVTQDHQVLVNGVDAQGKETQHLFDRVIIALGPIQTAGVLLRSGICSGTVEIYESRMVIIPFFLRNLGKTSSSGHKRISLSDAFLFSNANRPAHTETEFFAQLYGHSEALQKKICEQIPALRRLPPRILTGLLERIGLAMVFFAQPGSAAVRVTKREDKIVVRQGRPGIPLRAFWSATSALLREGMVPIVIATKWAPHGHSFHLGASFPIFGGNSGRPVAADWSGDLGEPNGTARLHVVDGSSLPQVPAFPVSGLVMANAIRISRLLVSSLLGRSGRESG